MSSAFLQSWFRAQCNGFWEHGKGVTIETLDSGGWMVTIDVAETTLEGHSMEPLRKERDAKDWIACTVEQNKFRGQGDSDKLDLILATFAAWAGQHTPSR